MNVQIISAEITSLSIKGHVVALGSYNSNLLNILMISKEILTLHNFLAKQEYHNFD